MSYSNYLDSKKCCIKKITETGPQGYQGEQGARGYQGSASVTGNGLSITGPLPDNTACNLLLIDTSLNNVYYTDILSISSKLTTKSYDTHTTSAKVTTVSDKNMKLAGNLLPSVDR